MTLNTNHVAGDANHPSEHNALATQVNTNTANIALAETTAHASATYLAMDHSNDTAQALFSGAAVVAVHNAVNGIVGYALNDDAASTTAFPAGITGYGRTNNAGNSAYGLFGRADLYAAGVATNEVNSFNYSAAPAGTYPPVRAIGTTDNVAVALTVATGGTFPSAIGIQIAREGSAPQPMQTGIYVNPDACTVNGIFIDGTSTSGPTTGIKVNMQTGGVGLVLNAATGATVDIAQFKLNGTTVAKVTNSGGLSVTTNPAGSTPDTLAIVGSAGGSKYMRVNASGVLQVLNSAFSTVITSISDAGDLTLTGGLSFAPATTTTAPGAGGAGALPATPAGYATVTIGGVARKVAYY